jgi:hypothetical protein
METIEEISRMIDEMLAKIPRDRDYNAVFVGISKLLMEKHSYTVPPMDLRFRFTLFMQQEFDAIPKEQWKIDDSAWLAEKEHEAKDKLLAWIEQEIM